MKTKILLFLLMLSCCFLMASSLSIKAYSTIDEFNNESIDLQAPYIKQIVYVNDNGEEEIMYKITNQAIYSCLDKSITIIDNETDEDLVICTIKNIIDHYGVNGKIIIRDDENDDGTVICSIGDYVEQYGTNGKIIIRDDENDEGTVICLIENDYQVS